MYKFGTTKRFDKALKLCRKRGYPIEELRKAIAILVENGSLPSEYKPHILHGNHEGEWEAHIKPNWLLVWEQNDDVFFFILMTIPEIEAFYTVGIHKRRIDEAEFQDAFRKMIDRNQETTVCFVVGSFYLAGMAKEFINQEEENVRL